VADMRSPHSLGWSQGLLQLGIEPVIVSSRALSDQQRSQLPRQVAAAIVHEPSDPLSRSRIWLTSAPRALQTARRLTRGLQSERAPGAPAPEHPGPEGSGRLELPLELAIAHRLGGAILKYGHRYRPDCVHALRVPFEGVAATRASRYWPSAISIWGSDLARQAPAHPRLAKATRQALLRAGALHADCRRDIALARQWGVPESAVSLMAAGNMGFDESVFHPAGRERRQRSLVVMPRGTASHVNYLGSLAAASRLAPLFPEVTFVGVRLRGDAGAETMRAGCRAAERIVLTGPLTSREYAELCQNAVAVLSPTISDGTPNSVLEAMACGAVPIAGDIGPLRDLLGDRLSDGLVDPTDAAAIQAALEQVITLTEPRWQDRSQQARQVAGARWSRTVTLPRVHDWYDRLVSSASAVPSLTEGGEHD